MSYESRADAQLRIPRRHAPKSPAACRRESQAGVLRIPRRHAAQEPRRLSAGVSGWCPTNLAPTRTQEPRRLSAGVSGWCPRVPILPFSQIRANLRMRKIAKRSDVGTRFHTCLKLPPASGGALGGWTMDARVGHQPSRRGTRFFDTRFRECHRLAALRCTSATRANFGYNTDRARRRVWRRHLAGQFTF